MESDSDYESEFKPPHLLKVEFNSLPESLPELSKAKYEKAYKWFMDWQKDHYNSSSCSENIFVDYFKEMSNKCKSSTLWGHYSMLRTTVNINHNVDISNYLKLKAFLKQQSSGYQPQKWKTFTSQDINKFITQAPDDQYLLAKVALIMGVMGGCRRHELHQMTMSNINDLGSAVIVTIPNTRTKFLRTFTITGYHYEFFKKYADLRPDNITDSSFFLNYRNGRCGTMRVGINKFGAMGKVIAKYLKLPNPELYTGHNFRKSCATVLVDSDEYLASSRANRKKSAESCELISCKPTADLVEDAAVVRKVENIYEECVMDDDPLDIKYDEFNENKYVAAANNAQTSISPSSSKTQLYENQSNVSFEYNLKHLPKLIFNNCTNVTINVIHNNK